ncbi:MAG: ribonuclease P protein component [Patescibacteria group bacterium]|nr:ribonuclease P protein component [Patescibacteria group bacterium]MDE1988178.1 ribonuclease P protein component [Patescibacteria group bacterium]MDE2218024.1 ribonuclease P protein component [Patescibacteria group bacterium]
MLKKKNRVDKSLFKDVVRKGVGYYSQNIFLKIVKNSPVKPKFSVSAPKKEIKTAVKRNLLKRRIFSILHKVLPKTKPPFICVIFAKKEALNLPYSKLEDEIVFLLKKAKILS